MSKSKSSSRAVALSLGALILITGCLGVVALLDSEDTYNVQNPVEYDEDSLFVSTTARYAEGNNLWATPVSNLVFLRPSETGGSYVFDMSAYLSGSYNIIAFRMDIPTVTKAKTIVVTTNMPVSDIVLSASGANIWNTMEKAEAGVFTYEFSTVDMLKLRSSSVTATGLNFFFNSTHPFPSDGIMEFSVDMYYSETPVHYVSSIVLVLGLIMIACAIFATPMVNGKDLKFSIKRRKH